MSRSPVWARGSSRGWAGARFARSSRLWERRGEARALWEPLEPRHLLAVDLTGAFTLSPINVRPGDTLVDVPYSVTNTGDEASPDVPVRFVLSLSGNAADPDNIILRDFAVQPVPAGQNRTGFQSLLIPTDTPAGSYTLLMLVDPDNQVAETNENNNVASSGVGAVAVAGTPVFADLSVTISVAGGTFLPRQELNVTLTSRNLGQAAAIDFVTRIVLSRNTVFGDGDDISLEDLPDGLLAGEVFTDTGTVLIPEVIAPGSYYVIVKIDANNQIDESNESNNESRTASASIVIAPPPVVSIVATRPTTSETAGLGGLYTLTRTGPTTQGLSVNLVIGGTATPEDDYLPLATVATFLPGQTSITILLTPVDDLLVEPSETVIVSLAAGVGYTVSATQSIATVTITDNEPTISVVTTRHAGESPLNTGLFTFTRSGGTNTGPLTIFYALATGTTASSGVDYEPLTGSVTFAAGSATATVLVTSIQDQVVEPTEFIVIAITAHESYRVSSTQHTATVQIADDEPTITVAATDNVASETAGNTATFTLTRSNGDITSSLTVNYTYLAGSTAIAGVDFVALPLSVTFAPGATTATVVVTAIDDALVEDTESMGITLLPNAAYRLGAVTSASATILDNEATITLTSADAVASETAGDTAILTFTRSIGDISGPLTVLYQILPGATISGPDYLATPGLGGQITFAAGSATATITITGIDDSLVESTETMTIALIAQNSYRLGASTQVTISILDNEPTITLVASQSTISETTGSHTASFIFTRGAGDISGPLTVLYAISPSSTVNGTDYLASPTLTGSITFAAGSATATITITAIDDTAVENDETLTISLIAQNSYRLGAQTVATITVVDNEPTVTLTASVPVTAEGGSTPGVFTFTRTGGPLTAPLNILYTIHPSSTASGPDFFASPAITSSITIPAGASSITITITPVDDALAENDETVVLTLTPQGHYRVGGSGAAAVTILDNEPRVSVTAANGAEGGQPVVFTLSRTGPTTGSLVTTFTLTGAALMGTDYASVPLTATFAAGQSTTTVTLNIIDDAIVEPAESVILTLVAGAAYSVSPTAGSATATIADNEPTVSVAATTPAGAEQAGGSGFIRFTLTRGSGTIAGPLTVTFTLAGTATGGADYTAIPLSATFAAGAATTTVTIFILDDALAEPTETIILNLSSSTAYRVSETDGSATASILDNEPIVSVFTSTTVVGEGEGAPIVFTLSRTGPTTGPLTVTFTLTGDAIMGADYQAVPLSATFAAGSSTATVTLSIIDDALAEAAESVLLTILDGSAYHASATQRIASATIADNEPTVSVLTVSGTSTEGGTGAAGQLVFRLTRAGGPLTSPLSVNFTLTGSAIMGQDYATIPLMATFAVGEATTTVTISIIDDALAEDLETVILTLAANAAYRINPSQATASGTIADNEPTVSVTAAIATATEGRAGPIRFMLQRTSGMGGSLAQPLTVNFTLTGTATAGDDFTGIPLSVTFAANSATAMVLIDAIDDLLAEDPETVILQVSSGAAYRVSEVRPSATGTILDNEPVISVTAATPSVVEGAAAPMRFMLQRTGGSLTQPLTVNFTLTGAATAGDDYTVIPLSATFAANSASVVVTIQTVDDTLVEPSETVILTLLGASTHTVSPIRGSATALLTDNEPEISVAATDPRAGEASAAGRPDTGRVTFTRTGPLTQPLTINYVVLGTATSGLDYLPLTGTVTFAAGAATAIVDVTPIDDVIAEPAETVVIQVGWGAAYRINAARSSATITITDDEPVVSIAATAPAATETNAAPARFTFTRTGPLSGPLTVSYTLAGTATAGADYLAPSGLIEIPAGQRTAVLVITPIDDALAEDAETIIVTITPTEAYAASPTQSNATARITDNEPTVSITATDAIAGESNNPGRFTVRRSVASASPLTVFYEISGSAATGTDYLPLSGTVTIAAGALSADIDVTVLQDLLGEGDETVIVTLSAAPTYRLVTATSTARVTIQDDEPIVTLSVMTPSVAEGSGSPIRFSVRRAGDLSQAVTVLYDLGNGTAQPGLDYTAPSGSITFAPGAATATIEIAVIDDSIGELGETLSLELIQADGYRLGAMVTATATITDNEPTITVAATAATTAEGGTTPGRFTLTRTGPTTSPLTVNYTLEGAAIEGDDYEPLSGSVTFAAGSTTAVVLITPIQDDLGEGSEAVILRIDPGAGYRPVNAAMPARVTINDDEPVVTVTASDPRAAEGPTDTAKFLLRRTGPTTAPLTVSYVLTGSAGPSDFEPLSGVVTFQAGQATTEVILVALVDPFAEPDETVVLTITSGVGYAVGAQAAATVTIIGNGPEVSVRATDAAAAETAPGVTPNPGRFTFSRTGPTTGPLTVFFRFEGTATLGDDYANPGTSVTFAAGQASVTLDLAVIDDDLGEDAESVILVIEPSDAYRVSTTLASARVNIADDEARVTLSTADGVAHENGDTARFIVTRAGPLAADLLVHYTLGGTATNGDDYQMLTGSVVIPAGQRTATITVAPIGENVDEPQETVTILLSPGAGYSLGTPVAGSAVINNLVAADLVVSTLTFLPATFGAATPGQTLELELGFANLGLLAAGPFSIEIRLTANDILGDADDVILSVIAHPGLAAGANGTFMLTILLDAAGTPPSPGSYRLGARIDSARRVVETSESNNDTVSPMPSITIVA